MTDDQPLWKQGLAVVDSTLSTRVDSAVRSEQFAVAVALVSRARSGLAGKGQRVSRKLWHTLNLPAATDVNRLLTHLGALERQVRELSKQLDDAATQEGVETRAADRTLGDSGTNQP